MVHGRSVVRSRHRVAEQCVLDRSGSGAHVCNAISRFCRGVVLCLLATLVVGTANLSAADVSTLTTREALVLLPTAAHLSGDGHQWVVPLHAWVYVPQQSQVRRRAIAELLKLGHGLDVTPESAPIFDERVNLLLADNKRGRTIVVDVGGVPMTLPPTGANGHTEAHVLIPVSGRAVDGARILMRAVLPASDSR